MSSTTSRDASFVYGSMLGGTAVVSGVLVKILPIDPKQILTYITEGKFDGKYWKNMLDTRDEEDMGSTTGPSIEEFNQPCYDLHGRRPKGPLPGPGIRCRTWIARISRSGGSTTSVIRTRRHFSSNT